MLETLKEWDRDLFVFLNSLGIEQYDSFWIFITKIESWTFLFVFLSIILFFHLGWKKGLIVFISIVLTFWLTLFITDTTKDFVARLRPNNVGGFSELIRVLQHPTSYSFFSGHASTSFAISTFAVLMLRSFNRWIFLVYLWPLLFVLSRIYVGVHYPSDILVGALVGSLMGLAGYKLTRFILARYMVKS